MKNVRPLGKKSHNLMEAIKDATFLNDANFCSWLSAEEVESPKGLAMLIELEKLGVLKSQFLLLGDSYVRCYRFNGFDKLPRQ